MINNFGLIWENLSITPCVPKSGEQEDHIAPIVLVAIKHSTVSIWFAVYAAILSFSLILLSLKNLNIHLRKITKNYIIGLSKTQSFFGLLYGNFPMSKVLKMINFIFLKKLLKVNF